MLPLFGEHCFRREMLQGYISPSPSVSSTDIIRQVKRAERVQQRRESEKRESKMLLLQPERNGQTIHFLFTCDGKTEENDLRLSNVVFCRTDI